MVVFLLKISAVVAAVFTVVGAIPTNGSSIGFTTENIVDLPAVHTTENIAMKGANTEEVTTQELLIGWFWEDPSQGGASSWFGVPYLRSPCMTLVPEWNNRISSIYIKGGFVCYWFTDEGCSVGGGRTGGPDDILYYALESNFDDNISSFRCDYY